MKNLSAVIAPNVCSGESLMITACSSILSTCVVFGFALVLSKIKPWLGPTLKTLILLKINVLFALLSLSGNCLLINSVVGLK